MRVLHISYYASSVIRVCTVIVLASFMNLGSVWGQDAIFSQYYAFKPYLNPALAGYEEGTTFHTQLRQQHFVFDNEVRSFHLRGASVSMSLPAIQSGVAISYLNSEMGQGPLSWNHVGLTYAWNTRSCNAPLNLDSWELGLGGTVSYNAYNLRQDNFIFSDQLRLFNLPTDNTQFQRLDEFTNLNPYLDLSVGGVFTRVSKKGNAINVGFAAHHIVRVENSIFGREDTLAPRFTLHANYIINRLFGWSDKQRFQLVPMAKVDLQANSWPSDGNWNAVIDAGLLFSMRTLPGFFGGALMRFPALSEFSSQTNSIILLGGIELGNDDDLDKASQVYRIGFSMDIAYSGLRSDSKGTYEIVLSMNLPEFSLFGCNSRSQSRYSYRCPKF